jgi:F1F0 ATPase subunit 2
MHDLGALLWAAAAGAALGGVFFVGLWWTVQLVMIAHNPVPWFLGSLLLRMGAVLAGFYFVGLGHWDRLAACFLGFAAARVIVTVLPSLAARGRRRADFEVKDAP